MLVSLAALHTMAIRFSPSEIYIKELDRDPGAPVVKVTATFPFGVI